MGRVQRASVAHVVLRAQAEAFLSVAPLAARRVVARLDENGAAGFLVLDGVVPLLGAGALLNVARHVALGIARPLLVLTGRGGGGRQQGDRDEERLDCHRFWVAWLLPARQGADGGGRGRIVGARRNETFVCDRSQQSAIHDALARPPIKPGDGRAGTTQLSSSVPGSSLLYCRVHSRIVL